MPIKIKTGLVGFGIAGKAMHAPFLAVSDEYEIVAVLERNREDSKLLFPKATIVRSFEELLQTNIELVIITTPNDTHFPYAMQALAAGKHVALEKPFTNTSADALALIEAAKKAGKILSVYQNRRYVSDFLTVKEIVEKKRLGEIHEYEARYDRYRPEARPNAWREEVKPGSGILFDLGAHLIDQALYLFGLPKTITADVRCQRSHARVDDFFDVRLDYGFLRVTLKAGMLVLQPGPRYLLHGTTGSFIKYGDDPQEARLRNGELPNTADWGQEAEKWYGHLSTIQDGVVQQSIYPSQKGYYGYYYQNLYKAIVNNAEVTEKPEHGYNTIRLIELAFKSSEEKTTLPCTNLLDVKYR